MTWQQRNETSLARFLAAPRQFPAFALALLACGAVAQVGDGEMDLNSYFSVRQDEKAAALLLPVDVPGLRLAAARVGLTPAGEDIVLAAAGVVLKGRSGIRRTPGVERCVAGQAVVECGS